MTSKFFTSLTRLFSAVAAFVFSATATLAQITNPAISPDMSDYESASSGALFAQFFIRTWNVAISIGTIMFMVYFVVAAYEWIIYGSDKGKLEKARARIVQGVIGLFILVCSHLIIGVISYLVFGDSFNILNPFSNYNSSVGGTSPACTNPATCSNTR